MKRVEGFDVARGWAVALVVPFHAMWLPQCEVRFLQPVSRMALVMLISGVMAAPALERDWSYTRERALNLAWIYLLWTPAVVLGSGAGSSIGSIVIEALFPSTPLWYIGSLALLIASAPLAKRHVMIVLMVTGATALGRLASGGDLHVVIIDKISHFAVFFYIGLFFNSHIYGFVSRCGVTAGIIAFCAIAVLLILPVPHGIITIAVAFALLLAAQGVAVSPAGSAFVWFGRRTLDVYLAHAPLLALAAWMTGPFRTGGLILISLAVIAGCLALRSFAEKVGLGWLYQRPRFSVPHFSELKLGARALARH